MEVRIRTNTKQTTKGIFTIDSSIDIKGDVSELKDGQFRIKVPVDPNDIANVKEYTQSEFHWWTNQRLLKAGAEEHFSVIETLNSESKKSDSSSEDE